MSDYTPGPWTFVEAGTRGEDGPTYFSISSKEFGWIATTPTYDQTAEANARLIAAAPDLLTAAEEVLRSSHSGCACFECEQLAAAIKKAKGQ